MKNIKVENEFENGGERESLNNTFDSIDLGNRDYTTPYQGEFNKRTPNFKGLPRDYYPTTCSTFCIAFLMIFPIYIVCGLLFWGLIVWGLEDAKTVGYVSLLAFVVYLCIIFIVVYIFSA